MLAMNHSKISKYLFLLCFCAFQQLSIASSDTFPVDAYPLGGVWRASLPPDYHALHLEMAKKELEETTGRDRETKFLSNVALCQLNAYLDNGDGTSRAQEILGIKDKVFLSGGYIIPEGGEDFISIVHDRDFIAESMKKKKASLDSVLRNLSKLIGDIDLKGSVSAKLQQAQRDCALILQEYEELKAKASEIHALRENYESKSVFQDPAYEYTNSLYDAEQVMIRQIDRKLRGINDAGENFIMGDGIELPKGKIKGIVLHVHTRFDMCPYCLESFHRRFEEWKGKFGRIPFNIIVSSRQEYIPSAMILYTFPSYQGASMRYVGIDIKSRNPLVEGELEWLSSHNLIAQASLSSWDILGL